MNFYCRIELHIKFDKPNEEGRKRVFEIHTKKLRELNRLKDVNFDKLAKQTSNFSGAEIEGVVKRAAIICLERLADLKDATEEDIKKHSLITQKDFNQAIEELKKTNVNIGEKLCNIYG